MMRPTISATQAIHSPREEERRLEISEASFLTTTLFLGDLSVLCNESSICELFGRYGELERVQLKRSDRDTQRAHLGFGFVKFVSRACAERALEELNGQFFLGRALRVGWADENQNRIASVLKATDPKKHHQTAQLHVSFLTRDLKRIVSEMDLGGVFGRFGNVVDIAVKKNFLNKSGCQSGYAFIHFSLTLEGLESALMASERVNNCTIDNISYRCKTDQTLMNQYLLFKSSSPSAHTKFEFEQLHQTKADDRSPFTHLESDHKMIVPRPKPTPFPLAFNTYRKSEETPRTNGFKSMLHTSNSAFITSIGDSRTSTCSRYAVVLSPSISRSSSSMKENYFPAATLNPSISKSISSSISYDEFPYYRRGMMKDSYYNPV